MIKISTCIKLSNNEILKNLKSTRKQMLVSITLFNSMNTYSHSEAMQFLLTRSYTYPIQKLKTYDRVKTRNTSFIPSFITQCSLLALSFLITLSCSLLHGILTILTCVSIYTCTCIRYRQ